MEKFIQSHLEELRSQQETRNLIGELSSRITDHRGRVRQLLRSEPLRHPEVVPLILVSMAADRPLESNFFPGLLEGLLGSLGIAAPRQGNPPSSSREGAGHVWSSAMCEAISWIEQKEVEAPGAVGLPQGLDLRYEEDFLKKQRHQIAFCPYCGVMNENSVTAYSHMRKHLGITFLCGGCYGKLYKVPQHLSQHMKSCHPCLMNRPEGSR